MNKQRALQEELDKKLKELESLELSLQAQISNYALEEVAYHKKNLIEFFEPSPKQLKFFQRAECNYRAIFAGNRFGKTEVSSVEDVSWALGERRFFPKDHPLRRAGIPAKGVKILVIAEDWDKVGELFTNDAEKLDTPGKVVKYLPADAKVTKHRSQNGVVDQIFVEVVLDGIVRKSGIFFDTVKSFKNNPKSFESSDWDLIHFDEPVPEDLFKAVTRGLIDRNGKFIGLLTPLSEPWIYYMFSETTPQDEEKAGWWWEEASIYDNPLLSLEAIEAYFKQFADPAEIACRKSGKPLATGNLVLSTYDEAKHLWRVSERGIPAGWKDAVTPPRDYYCALAIDTHPQTPTAVLFVAIAPTGQVFFYDELWIGGLEKARMSYIASEILLRTNKVRVGYTLLEPAAWVEDPETGRCFADVFEDNGISVEPASKARTYAIQQIQMLFASDRKVFILDHCVNIRKEIARWSFTKDNRPKDADDHFCECLGRLVVHDNLDFHKEEVFDLKSSSFLRVSSLDLNKLLVTHERNYTNYFK